MMSPLDPFVRNFDSIEIDPLRAPSPAAIDAAIAMCAPPESPGFRLLDDAHGRFVVDPEFGVISLREEATLSSERGQIHEARLRVVEQSGAAYDLKVRLRITGRVPQLVADDESCDLFVAEHAPAAAESVCTPWPIFAACAGGRADAFVTSETAAFVVEIALPRAAIVIANCDFVLALLPAPAPAAAHWTIV